MARSTVRGRVDVTHLPLRGQRVAVRTYLPPGFEDSDGRYPVLYMFDGHNLFDRCTSTYGKEWRVDETMQRIAAEGRWSPAVVVGIDAPGDQALRCAMYSLGEWEFRRRPDSRALARIEGYGEQTSAFLTESVKPYTETTYGVPVQRESVGVAGSSMGGYMTLYTAAAYPALVSKAMAFSPAALDFPMRGDRLREHILAAGAPRTQRFYLDMGGSERLEYAGPAKLMAHLRDVHETLLAAGHMEIEVRRFPRDRHDESAWARRFGPAYLWTFHGVGADLPLSPQDDPAS
jgi:enterochelin esterase-like enzyme